MNAKIFKQLIKEAVKEAVREELKQVLAEHAASQLVARPIIYQQQQAEPHFDTVPRKNNVNESKTFTFNTQNTDVTQARSTLKSKMDNAFGFKTPETEASHLSAPVGNDFSAFLVDAAQNMTPQEIAGLKNMG